MNEITYKTISPTSIAVKLDNRLVGHIKSEGDKWRYYTQKSKGDLFDSIEDCKKSLSGESE